MGGKVFLGYIFQKQPECECYFRALNLQSTALIQIIKIISVDSHKYSMGPSSRPLFVQRLFFEPQMNLDKKQLFPKVASSPVFLPAEF